MAAVAKEAAVAARAAVEKVVKVTLRKNSAVCGLLVRLSEEGKCDARRQTQEGNFNKSLI